MHDQSLEQRLRAALQTEGDRIPLTITAAELERRLARRRRGGLSSMASLGLAAAVGAGLLGLAGVAGGWFEQRPVATPAPSILAAVPSVPGDGPPATAPATPDPILLPSLDELVAPIDEATIVRAQAVGTADGSVSMTPIGPRTVTFAPLVEAGAYRIWTTCLSSDDMEVWVIPAGGFEPRERIPITCDASITRRDVGIEPGDLIQVVAGGPMSWRVAVQAPERPAPHATAIADVQPQDPTDELLLDVRSESREPVYGQISTGGGIFVPEEFGMVAPREAYRVSFSCAGPRAIRYAFHALEGATTSSEEPEEFESTQVDCDGAVHEDTLHLPNVDTVRLFVTADSRDAWRIVVSAAAPPIALAPDGDGWMMSTGFGPNYYASGKASEVSLVGPEDGGSARVVISCFGDQTITGTIDVGPVPDKQLDPFTLDCNVEHANAVELTRTYAKAGQVHVVYELPELPVWLAVTVQIRGQ